MGGLKWTITGFDEEWLESHIPRYRQLLGQPRVKNEEMRAFIRQVIVDYEKKFPGHSNTWQLSGITEASSKDERNAKIKEVSQFFGAYIIRDLTVIHSELRTGSTTKPET